MQVCDVGPLKRQALLEIRILLWTLCIEIECCEWCCEGIRCRAEELERFFSSIPRMPTKVS